MRLPNHLYYNLRFLYILYFLASFFIPPPVVLGVLLSLKQSIKKSGIGGEANLGFEFIFYLYFIVTVTRLGNSPSALSYTMLSAAFSASFSEIMLSVSFGSKLSPSYFISIVALSSACE